MNTIPIHTPDEGSRASGPVTAGRPGPRSDGAGRVPDAARAAGAVADRLRRVAVLSLLALASCGTPSFESMTGPVEAFVTDVKSGVRGTGRLRYCFSTDVEDQMIQDSVPAVVEAMKRHGSETKIEVLVAWAHKAELRVTIGDSASFTALVQYEEGGWRIRKLDVESLQMADF